MAEPSKSQIRQELVAAVIALSDRGLYFAAKWAAELLTDTSPIEDSKERLSLSPGGQQTAAKRGKRPSRLLSSSPAVAAAAAAAAFDSGFADTSPASSSSLGSSVSSSSASSSSPHIQLPPPEPVEEVLLLAKTYFDLKQYRRVGFVLEGTSSPRALFLKCYARFLAGERRKEEETLERSESRTGLVVNKELPKLNQELSPLRKAGKLDGFGLFLLGLVHKELDQKESAIEVLVESANLYPWNWSCWRALTALVEDPAQISKLGLQPHWMRQFFLADVCIELYQHDSNQVLTLLEGLNERFPHSTHVLAQTAMAHYNKREFDEAQELFEQLHEHDPFRLEGMDTYSNILYVKESRGDLSYLAHTATENDKYRPQTCVIVGNYYSLKGQHAKAILYFKRALRLDPAYLSAWTLMGHEYVEMRNTEAAIEAYRHAVDINPRDYRAWYGLGQAYELLQMNTYSLYYFRKATELRPYDSRMWCAMAECYERLTPPRLEDAINCYLRAEGNNDREGIALGKLANLYMKLGDERMAACYFAKVLRRRDQESKGALDTEAVEALFFLTEHSKKTKNYNMAEHYCRRIMDTGGQQTAEKAKSLFMEIRQLRRHEFTGCQSCMLNRFSFSTVCNLQTFFLLYLMWWPRSLRRQLTRMGLPLSS
eukprot:g4442.t1